MYASSKNGPPPMTVPASMAYSQYPPMSDPNAYASSIGGTPQISSHTNSKDPSMVKARVFVGNLNTFRVSREDLVNLFQSCGNVLGATLFKGYAFVQFSTATEAELCVQTLNGYTWEGSELDVKLAFTTPPHKTKPKTEYPNNEQHQVPVSAAAAAPASSINPSAHHTIDLYYKNQQFAKEIQRQLFERHGEGSLEDMLLCGECRFRTSDINDFADHKSRECSILAKTPPEPESIQCFTCEDTFPTSWHLLQHLIDKHNLNLYRDASEETVETRGPRTPSPLPSEDIQSEQNATNNETQETFGNSPAENETKTDEEEMAS